MMNANKMDTSIPYYEDNSRISNSAIGWFMKNGPLYLKNMLDGKEEGITGTFLEKGTMIHEYILQPEEFWKDYIILDFTIPKVKQQKDLLEFYTKEKLINPFATENDLLLKSYNNAYSNSKSDDKKIQEAKELVETYADYIKYLQTKDDKKIISFADLQTLKKIKANIEEHKKANELLYGLSNTYECHNEFHINWEVPKYKVKCNSLLDRVCFDHVNKKLILINWDATNHKIPCKSLLDSVIFDHENRKITLIDLKTTADVYNFKHSVEEFDYYRQIAYYGLAIQWYMQEVLNLNSEEYDFEAYIIAIGKDKDNQIRVFNMYDDSIIRNKVDQISDCLKEISYHINSGQWDHTRSYYENDGVEELCETT